MRHWSCILADTFLLVSFVLFIMNDADSVLRELQCGMFGFSGGLGVNVYSEMDLMRALELQKGRGFGPTRLREKDYQIKSF